MSSTCLSTCNIMPLNTPQKYPYFTFFSPFCVKLFLLLFFPCTQLGTIKAIFKKNQVQRCSRFPRIQLSDTQNSHIKLRGYRSRFANSLNREASVNVIHRFKLAQHLVSDGFRLEKLEMSRSCFLFIKVDTPRSPNQS